MILPKKFFFQNIKIKLNSRILMTLKSAVVIFQALKPLQPQNPYFTKKLRGPDGWIIPGTKMTNTVPFLLNESSKIQIFTDILYPFSQRLLRPTDVTFSKTKNAYQKFIILAF